MARIAIRVAGVAPLLMHNERLADPLNPYARWSAELAGKRKKTERDLEELGRRDFLGGGYWEIDEGPTGEASDPVIPSYNLVRSIQEAAKRFRLGKEVVRGIIPVDEFASLEYEGPRSAQEMWKDGGFHLRKGVVISSKRVIRTRPAFDNWALEVEVEVDLALFDPETVELLAIAAGKYEGLGDARPRFGRYSASTKLLGDPADYASGDVLAVLRERLAAKSARAAIEAADEAHAEVNPNGSGRRKRVAKKEGALAS